MNERIKRLRKSLDLTQEEFGKRIGVKQNTIAQIEMGRKTSDQTIRAICREFSVYETWLRTGEGEMFAEVEQDEEIAAFVGSVLSGENDSFKKRFISVLARLDEKDWLVLQRMAEDMFRNRTGGESEKED